MFEPTHLLISRRQKTPVQLVAGANGSYRLYTEQEWLQGREPAFAMNPQTGLFCRGIPVVGYELEPILANAATSAAPQAMPTAQTTADAD